MDFTEEAEGTESEQSSINTEAEGTESEHSSEETEETESENSSVFTISALNVCAAVQFWKSDALQKLTGFQL